MSRPEGRGGRLAPRTIAVLALSTLAFAGVLVFMVVQYVSQNPDAANLGSDVIRLNAERTAKTIENAGPYILQDPNERRDRDVYLQHTGDDPAKGWVLVLARGPDGCPLVWDTGRRLFEASCNKQTYPADGAGLTTFPAPVEGGRVVIDLRGG